MNIPLHAAATPAAALFAGSTFAIPAYQREYAWTTQEVREFWEDLRGSLTHEYFLGLVILTEDGNRKDVVDGQQRLLTLTLLCVALHRAAVAEGRQRLAERIEADFLRVLDFETDETRPRVTLTDPSDNETLQAILNGTELDETPQDGTSLSAQMLKAFGFLRERVADDISADPFKRLGSWTEFLTSRLYFAVFVHPDAASAYRVFEVVNTRGKELTTADLLKNYLLSQTPADAREETYQRWKALEDAFEGAGDGSFVAFIRYVATLDKGYILPKSLYDYLSGRLDAGVPPMLPSELLDRLEKWRPLYMQMTDPSLDGPADATMLSIFAALNEIGIVAARPLLLALHNTADAHQGAGDVLRLVVRRVVANNLGTGGIERRFSDAARTVHATGKWKKSRRELLDLDVGRGDFERALSKDRYNKGTLSFLRRSVLQQTVAPEQVGTLHFIRPRRSETWGGWSREDALTWETTIGNTVLAAVARRPQGAATWPGFKRRLLPEAIPGERVDQLKAFPKWDAAAVRLMGAAIASDAAEVWYG
jgi:hypothetical protein